jgi:hypothetical protein
MRLEITDCGITKRLVLTPGLQWQAVKFKRVRPVSLIEAIVFVVKIAKE